ncbi:MAG TPA: PDZ domain-containing protein, partial [Spirochaetia bacterium]
GERRSVTVRIGARDELDRIAQERNLWPGMIVVDITAQIRQEARIPRGTEGVVVAGLAAEDTPTAIAGLRPGDVIVAINGRPTRNLMEYYRALNATPRAETTFRVDRHGTVVTLGVTR